MPRYPLVLLTLLGLMASAHAQPTDCAATPGGYAGPCYYGALPAFFDDFAYSSVTLPAPTPDSGSLFGSNAWALREGTTQTRGWYRYNRDDLPTAGRIALAAPSVLEIRLPEGLPAETHRNDPTVYSGTTLGPAGTYLWRVRLSPQWPGQRLIQAAWLIAPEQFYFDRITTRDTTRYYYAPELDFENENWFHGEHTASGYLPDYVTRMSVTNLMAQVHGDGESRGLSHEGPVDWPAGHGVLARTGAALYDVGRAAPVAAWADRWVDLMLVVDEAARTTTYRMLPVETWPGDPLQTVAARPITVDEAFYPASPLAAMLSLHWIHPEGRLANTLTLEADWFYHTPVVGLSAAELRAQVAHLQRRGLARVNTTDRPTFEPLDEPERLEAWFEEPERIRCGRSATWTLRAWPGGTRFHTTFRYRLLGPDDRPGPWQPVYAPALTLTPSPGQTGVELEAALQDLWAPHGTRTLDNGWLVPHPDNHTATARATARFDCGG